MNYHIFGIIFGILFAAVVFLVVKLRHPEGHKYDERQVVGRGKAFKAGFFTMLIAGGICSTWDFVSPLPGGSFLWNICALLLGVTVFAVTAIHYDAYVAMNDNPKRFYTMGICFIVALPLIGMSNLHSERSIAHTLGILDFVIAVMWVIIVAALLLHRRNSQKEDE